METCPLCKESLINGKDGPLQIEYSQENLAKFNEGKITLDELNSTAKFFYMRKRLCKNKGNENTYTDEEETKLMNPPCANYYGVRGGTTSNPDVIVEEIKIYDE